MPFTLDITGKLPPPPPVILICSDVDLFVTLPKAKFSCYGIAIACHEYTAIYILAEADQLLQGGEYYI